MDIEPRLRSLIMLMRNLLASTAIVLTIGATLPAASADDTVTVESSADIDTRRAEMNDSMEAWRARVDEHRAEDNDVEDAMDSAWNNVEAAWADVENATEENWDDASGAFDSAMDDLEKTWDDATDGDSGT